MTFTPRRLALAAAFVFVLLTLRPLLAATPDSWCGRPILLEALRSKTVGGGAAGFARNGCIDHARAELGATATRLAFLGVLGLGVAMILGWRPRRLFGGKAETVRLAYFMELIEVFEGCDANGWTAEDVAGAACRLHFEQGLSRRAAEDAAVKFAEKTAKGIVLSEAGVADVKMYDAMLMSYDRH